MVLILEADTIVDNARSRCIEAYRVSQNAERKPLGRICGRTFSILCATWTPMRYAT